MHEALQIEVLAVVDVADHVWRWSMGCDDQITHTTGYVAKQTTPVSSRHTTSCS